MSEPASRFADSQRRGDKSRRWRPRFGVRALLLGVVILAAALAVVGEPLRAVRREARALTLLSGFCARVQATREALSWRDRFWPRVSGLDIDCGEQAVPAGHIDIHAQSAPFSAEAAAALAEFQLLETLAISGPIEPAAFQRFARLSAVEVLDLSSSTVGDDDLPELAKMPRLSELHLQNTDVTEDGLRRLRELRADIEAWDD